MGCLLYTSITFDQHIDPDMAQIQVQNRVSRVLSRLPDEVQRQGVVTQKTSPDILMVVHLLSPEQRYDPLYISCLLYTSSSPWPGWSSAT